MAVASDTSGVGANSRLTAIRLALLTSRSMELWRRGGDLDGNGALIMVAVVAITFERLIRTGLSGEMRALGRSVPAELHAICNVSSIAAATGLNRETARRRVKALMEKGLLVRSPRGVIALRPDLHGQADMQALVRKQLEAVTRFINDAIRDGVLVPAQGIGRTG
jgi:hypothetical protein